MKRKDITYLTHNEISTFIYNVLIKEKTDSFSASAVSKGLVHASLRGVDSHGISLLPHYLDALKGGRINGTPNFKIEQTAHATAILDADNAFGHAAGIKAAEEAVKIAKESGIGAVSVKRSSHFGAASFFSLEISKNNMLGFSFTHSDPLVPPTGSKTPFLGNNPICFTAPCEDGEPICLDMATSMITFNKVLRLREANEKAPLGVGLDKDGFETTDPNKIVSLVPVGGYKGYGLSLMVEILCALLAGMPFGPHIGHMYNDPLDKKRNIGHFFMAMNIESFQPLSFFKHQIKTLANELRDLERVNNDTPIMVAGDPEQAKASQRTKEGIPTLGNIVNYLKELSRIYNIELKGIYDGQE